jgi:tellurite resistance protein TehA-like permease
MDPRRMAVTPRQGLLLAAAAGLFPGYFALVMATGVVSIASHILGLERFAVALVAINWVAYAVLWALTLIRIVAFSSRLLADLSDHQRAPGFFTTVAATCVLGTQNAVVIGAHQVATLLWYLGIGLWVVVMYAFFTAVTVRERKPSLAAGINGAWLIAAVATQSIVVLGSTIGAREAPAPALQFLCLGMFMIGCMLYLAIIPLIFYRLTFVRLSSHDFSPPYWITMGAIAIATLAGSSLILRLGTWPVLAPIAPFLKGFTLFFWAGATWWIPFLAALTIWRHFVRGDHFRYEPQVWGMVFPLGMYTTGTYQLAQALELPFLVIIPQGFIYVAVIAWTLAFIGLVLMLARTLRDRVRAPLYGRIG